MLTVIAGFIAPFLPDLLGLVRNWQDHKHELEMRRVDAQLQRETRAFDLAQTELRADVEDVVSARAAQPTYGRAILDAMQAGYPGAGRFMRFNYGVVFLLFGLVEFLNALMRPSVVYYMFGLYGAVKAARFWIYLETLPALRFETTADWSQSLGAIAQALTVLWGVEDADLIASICAFLFAARHRQTVLDSVKR
jgi:hypothetical protein